MMFDPKRIPESTYNELVHLIGRKDAEEYIMAVQCDYRAVMFKIMRIHFWQFWTTNQRLILLIFAVFCVIVFWKDIAEFLRRRYT